MIFIGDDIYRLKVCAWAYNWNKDELLCEINKMIDEKQWECYFKRKEEEKETLDNLIFEINNRAVVDICIFKEDKKRSFGNKYIKRKFRY